MTQSSHAMTQSSYREPRAAGDGSADRGVAAANARHHAGARRSPSVRRFAFAVWAMLGFALGVSFWHAVGFLGFLEDLVAPRPALATVIVRSGADAAPAGEAAPRMVTQNCTTMMLERETGRTWARPCVALLQGPRDHSESVGARAFLQTAARLDRDLDD